MYSCGLFSVVIFCLLLEARVGTVHTRVLSATREYVPLYYTLVVSNIRVLPFDRVAIVPRWRELLCFIFDVCEQQKLKSRQMMDRYVLRAEARRSR